jgi:hypothetical protein
MKPRGVGSSLFDRGEGRSASRSISRANDLAVREDKGIDATDAARAGREKPSIRPHDHTRSIPAAYDRSGRVALGGRRIERATGRRRQGDPIPLPNQAPIGRRLTRVHPGRGTGQAHDLHRRRRQLSGLCDRHDRSPRLGDGQGRQPDRGLLVLRHQLHGGHEPDRRPGGTPARSDLARIGRPMLVASRERPGRDASPLMTSRSIGQYLIDSQEKAAPRRLCPSSVLD